MKFPFTKDVYWANQSPLVVPGSLASSTVSVALMFWATVVMAMRSSCENIKMPPQPDAPSGREPAVNVRIAMSERRSGGTGLCLDRMF